jgi:ATP-dependent Lon protease
MSFDRQYFANQGEDIEVMPIVPLTEEELTDEEKKNLPTSDLTILTLRNMVLFPNVVIPITVSRDKSMHAVKYADKNGKFIGVIAQKDDKIDEPTGADLFTKGTLAQIIKTIKMPDDSITIFIRGQVRFEVNSISQENPFFKADVRYLEDIMPKPNKEFKAMTDSVREMAEQIMQKSQNVPPEAGIILKNIENVAFLNHFISSNLNSTLLEKQEMLEMDDFQRRTEMLLQLLQVELHHVELKNKITNRTKQDIDKQQREYFLQQQMKSIKEELGGDSNDREIRDLVHRAEKIKLSKTARELFDKSIQKLERMHPTTPDYSITYNHLDLILDLPWDTYTTDTYDIPKARKILDGDHYGMHKIKDRLLEYLAVLKLKGDMKSPILCFVGPPGIGKTSLGKSIAHAINRKYTRLSLGGMHDESELRGHRKTYIGAMPGRLIQSLRKVKTSNPVFILDEIDKLGRDFRGDPSSALLEILDPEQNHTFYDNYLELEYDLSKVLFIATANSLQDIQPALRDRLEIINLNGYAVEEKIEIAKKHLIPKQKIAHGLKKHKIGMGNPTVRKIIEDYSRESGVRELDRQIASVMRNIAMRVATNPRKKEFKITPEDIVEILGKAKYNIELYKKNNPAGVAVGLAWTYVGGDILFIETAKSKSKAGLTLTGNLGNVMKESAMTALTFLKANAKKYDIEDKALSESHFHIHVPEGATPKDGPSAGVTMLTSLYSIITGRKVKKNLAMSGEITLRGQVLPVGGIKEKILAAKRAGIKEIILCKDNEKDILEIPQEFIKGLTFHYVDQMEEVLDIAIT